MYAKPTALCAFFLHKPEAALPFSSNQPKARESEIAMYAHALDYGWCSLQGLEGSLSAKGIREQEFVATPHLGLSHFLKRYSEREKKPRCSFLIALWLPLDIFRESKREKPS